LTREEEHEVRIGPGYPFGQMAKAFVTALTHEDGETRERAERRVAQWRSVLAGMASGKLSIGSRTPVKRLPAWVTPEVVRGGFATGSAAAARQVEAWERDVARRAGVYATHEALFAYYLTEQGLAELNSMLESGAYAVRIPEEAALLTVAWLVSVGENDAALELVGKLAPHSKELRFAPMPADPTTTEPSIVYRETVSDAARRLEKRQPNERVETMREALTVWNPFADEVLSLWLETEEAGTVARSFPEDWRTRGGTLLTRYRELAAKHKRCSKHRKPKENLAILLRALDEVVRGRDLQPRQAGLLQHAVNSMVAKRGRPGSQPHRELRSRQLADASLPTHHALARVVIGRLADLPQLRGVDCTDPLVEPITADEAERHGLAEGTAIPSSIKAVVERTLAAPPEVLIERGVVPSAEVLAELVPRIAGTTVAAAFRDERLRSLMGANYEAFRNRRSLLLLNLEHQVRVNELPWVQAVAPFKTESDEAMAEARAALVRLTELTLDAFPATILPSPLVTELDALSREAGLKLPLVEELAADIFMGSFSEKFVEAAKLAGQLLRGSLYERYYDIDYDRVVRIDDVRRQNKWAAPTSPTFDTYCSARAGGPSTGWSVATNGTIIEQAQILTTHNLATLTGPFGVGEAISIDWPRVARKSLDRALALADRLRNNPRPLRMVKDLAYAWRQTIFFLTRMSSDETEQFVTRAEDNARQQPAHVSAVMTPMLGGLRDVLEGASFDREGKSERGRRLLGWTREHHWVLEAAGVSRRPA
jgi:hypothetical protein